MADDDGAEETVTPEPESSTDFRSFVVILFGLCAIVCLTIGGFTINATVGWLMLGACLGIAALLLGWESPDPAPVKA